MTVWDDPEDPHSLSFELPMEGGRLYGHLQRSGQAVSIELAPGDEEVSEFAAWVREQVPDEQDLLLYDAPFNWSVPLEPGTSPAALVEELDAAAS